MNTKLPKLLPLFAIQIALVTQSYFHRTAGCEEFYKKTKFAARVIDKKPILTVADIDEHSFKITFQDSPRHSQSVAFYKNKQGQNLRMYTKPGDIIKKNKNEFTLIIARPINNALEIQKFDLSCDP